MSEITSILGEEADYLLKHESRTILGQQLHQPGPDFIPRVLEQTDRSPRVLRSLQSLFDQGRLGGTGYLSLFPVDQGVEHSAAASFAKNPLFMDPENIVRLALDGGCSGVASTLGVLGSVSRRFAHRIPFIVKLNHNELLSYPNQFDQTLFASVDQAFDLGAVAVGATIYYGSENSRRQIEEISEAFARAHELGMATILWAYLRNDAFKQNDADYHTAADLTGQANHMAATIGADIVKQKQADTNGGFRALNFGKTNDRVYSELTSEHPIDLVRYQVATCYMGRVGMINSGGASGTNDLHEVVRAAVINKRAGGMGLITGRKAFQKSMDEGINLLNKVQDVYLDNEISLA